MSLALAHSLRLNSLQETTSLDDIENVFLISDLHTDHLDNLAFIRDLGKGVASSKDLPGDKDALIIVGDVSHRISKIKQVLTMIKDNLKCHIFFIWGNHEAWVGGDEDDLMFLNTSTDKINAVNRMCRSLGVHTGFKLVGKNHVQPAIILPLDSYYDGTLLYDESCEDLCSEFDKWPWMDFHHTKWPSASTLERWCKKKDPNVDMGGKGENISKIPVGLCKWFALKNELPISKVQDMFRAMAKDEHLQHNIPGLITVSHFLPNKQSLPEWKDPTTDDFKRKEWLSHLGRFQAANFSKVAGSVLVDEQIRKMNKEIKSLLPESESVQHIHLFGHSHRPKDFVCKGIRYIHNPLGTPRERKGKSIVKNVRMQKVWDCRKNTVSEIDPTLTYEVSYAGGLGEIPGRQIVRHRDISTILNES